MVCCKRSVDRWRLESWSVLELMEERGSESSDRTRRREDWREETEERTEERERSADWREESWERRWWWRERTSERSWDSRRRMAEWSFSAVEAGEPEERAAEEKVVEEKDGERKGEKIGSSAKASRGDDDDGAAAPAEAAAEGVGDLKVERRWRGEDGDGEEDRGDRSAAGEAIFALR